MSNIDARKKLNVFVVYKMLEAFNWSITWSRDFKWKTNVIEYSFHKCAK